MLAEMKDDSNIELRMRIRMMSHVERASPDHCQDSYTLLNSQVIFVVGTDQDDGQVCKLTTIMD